MTSQHRKMKWTAALCLLLSFMIGNHLAASAQTALIDDLKRELHAIASDSTEGRFTASPGYLKAAGYVVGQLKAAGLQPGWVDKSGRKTFLQPVPFIRDEYGMTTVLSISKNGENRSYPHAADHFIVIHPGAAQKTRRQSHPKPLQTPQTSQTPQAPVFIGYGIEEPQEGWDDYAHVDPTGKWVVLLNGLPREDSGHHFFSPALRKKYGESGLGDSLKYYALLKHKVAGVILLPDPYITENWETTVIRQYRFGYMHYAGGGMNKKPVESVIPYILIHPKLAQALFADESYNPLTNEGAYHSFIFSTTRLTMTMDGKKTLVNSYNIIAVSKGIDERVKNEAIIVGAHLDHIGRIGNHIYNGANDDGSGCVDVLEAAKAIAANPVRRPVLFVFYTGEELNLVGSRHFMDHPPIPLANIFMNINLEQVGSKHRSFDGIWGVGADAFKPAFYKAGVPFTAPELKYDSIGSLMEELSNTDSYYFIKRNIPSLLLSSGGFAEHHTILDNTDLIDFEHLSKSSQLLNALVKELGNH